MRLRPQNEFCYGLRIASAGHAWETTRGDYGYRQFVNTCQNDVMPAMLGGPATNFGKGSSDIINCMYDRKQKQSCDKSRPDTISAAWLSQFITTGVFTTVANMRLFSNEQLPGKLRRIGQAVRLVFWIMPGTRLPVLTNRLLGIPLLRRTIEGLHPVMMNAGVITIVLPLIIRQGVRTKGRELQILNLTEHP